MRRTLLPFGVLLAAQLDGTLPLVSGSGCITWHSTYETTGTTAATYAIYDGPPSGEQLIMEVTLSAGQSTRDWIGLHNVPFIEGLWLTVVSGSIGGSVTAWVDHVCETYLRHAHEALELTGAEAAARLAAMA